MSSVTYFLVSKLIQVCMIQAPRVCLSKNAVLCIHTDIDTTVVKSLAHPPCPSTKNKWHQRQLVYGSQTVGSRSSSNSPPLPVLLITDMTAPAQCTLLSAPVIVHRNKSLGSGCNQTPLCPNTSNPSKVSAQKISQLRIIFLSMLMVFVSTENKVGAHLGAGGCPSS